MCCEFLVLGSLTALLFIGLSALAHPVSPLTQQGQQSAQTSAVLGKVVSIADDKKSFSLEVTSNGNANAMRFVVEQNTQVTGHMHVGTSATVKYQTGQDGKLLGLTGHQKHKSCEGYLSTINSLLKNSFGSSFRCALRHGISLFVGFWRGGIHYSVRDGVFRSLFQQPVSYSNSLSRGSGMPIQVRGVLVHAMSGTELSRVRTEIRLRLAEPINKSPLESRGADIVMQSSAFGSIPLVRFAR